MATKTYEIFRVEMSDRYISVTYDNYGKLIGINYTQGEDQYLLRYGYDEDLTKYYLWACSYIKGENYHDTEGKIINIEKIDDIIWLYVGREFNLHLDE
jgi:hypothetical protein